MTSLTFAKHYELDASVSTGSPRLPHTLLADPGQDLDDELAIILLRSLTAKKFVRPIGLVANLQPANARARLLKGTMRRLGLPDVPVAGDENAHTHTHAHAHVKTIAFPHNDLCFEHSRN